MDKTTDFLVRAQQFYDLTLKKYLLSDLEKSIKAGTNYLTALGCLVGTETIGTMLPRLEGEKGRIGEKHFYRCLFRLPSGTYLERLDQSLKKSTKKNTYQLLRNNIAHFFTPQVYSKEASGQVIFLPFTVAQKVVVMDSLTKAPKDSPPLFWDNKSKLFAINVGKYVEELKSVTISSYEKTFKEKDRDYVQAAIEGAKYVFKVMP